MSKLTEIQDQYQGYVAAKEAVKKTKPGDETVLYGNDGDYFFYEPERDMITIRHGSYSIPLKPGGIPALINALREFIE